MNTDDFVDDKKIEAFVDFMSILDKNQKEYIMVDPPYGFKYGFPKSYLKANPPLDIELWLVENGYPQSEIDRYEEGTIPVQFWYSTSSKREN